MKSSTAATDISRYPDQHDPGRTYRHGLRASEVCDLQWHQVELDQGRMHVRRAKNGTPSVHPIRGDEIRALRKLRRENPNEAYVFVTERGGPMSTIGFRHLVQRLGKAAKMPFPLHPHMLRHACGYKLANDGHDTRALQHYLGHKNIQHTVRYTELSPTGSGTSGAIRLAPDPRFGASQTSLDVRAADATPR